MIASSFPLFIAAIASLFALCGLGCLQALAHVNRLDHGANRPRQIHDACMRAVKAQPLGKGLRRKPGYAGKIFRRLFNGYAEASHA